MTPSVHWCSDWLDPQKQGALKDKVVHCWAHLVLLSGLIANIRCARALGDKRLKYYQEMLFIVWKILKETSTDLADSQRKKQDQNRCSRTRDFVSFCNAFFFLVKTWHLHYPQFNSTVWSEIWVQGLMYPRASSLKQTWGAGYRGLVSSLLSNSTPPEFSNS